MKLNHNNLINNIFKIRTNDGLKSATCFLISSKGYLLTCAHLFKKDENSLYSNQEIESLWNIEDNNFKVIDIDYFDKTELDYAILKCENFKNNKTFSNIFITEIPISGIKISCYGYGNSKEETPTAVDGKIRNVIGKSYQFNANNSIREIMQGDSGAPIFCTDNNSSAQNKIIGWNYGKVDYEGLTNKKLNEIINNIKTEDSKEQKKEAYTGICFLLSDIPNIKEITKFEEEENSNDGMQSLKEQINSLFSILSKFELLFNNKLTINNNTITVDGNDNIIIQDANGKDFTINKTNFSNFEGKSKQEIENVSNLISNSITEIETRHIILRKTLLSFYNIKDFIAQKLNKYYENIRNETDKKNISRNLFCYCYQDAEINKLKKCLLKEKGKKYKEIKKDEDLKYKNIKKRKAEVKDRQFYTEYFFNKRKEDTLDLIFDYFFEYYIDRSLYEKEYKKRDVIKEFLDYIFEKGNDEKLNLLSKILHY